MKDFNKLPAVFTEWLTYCRDEQHRSGRTLEIYLSDAEEFADYVIDRKISDPEEKRKTEFSIELLKTVSSDEIRRYLRYLSEEKHLSDASRIRKYTSLRSLYKYYYLITEQLDADPTARVPYPKAEKSEERKLSSAEEKKLLNSTAGTLFEQRDRAILSLFLNCGLKISELHDLNLKDLEKDRIHIHGRNGRERTIMYSPDARKDVRDYLDIRYAITPLADDDMGALFLSKNLTRLSTRRIHSMVDEKLSAAGLDNVFYRPGRLRSISSSVKVSNGVPMNVFKELLETGKTITISAADQDDSGEKAENK